jgi:hypothetical protein
MSEIMLDIKTRHAIADRIFKGALLTNVALTVFCLVAYFTGAGDSLAGARQFDAKSIGHVLIGIFFFNIAWGFIWYGIKNLLLNYVCGFTADERRAAFSSRMQQPFDIAELTARHSERRIRIVDMIGRRGRFMTLGLAFFFYLYSNIATQRPGTFATAFLKDNLVDGVITGWIFIALYYRNGLLSAALYGPQSRVMDGVLARANCLLIITLWAVFKFTLVPIGAKLATIYSPGQFAAIFAMIWGSYMICDTLAEVGGSIYGRQKIRVIGIGDVNRKSIGGTVTGFLGSWVFCSVVVLTNSLPTPFLALALLVSVSNTLIELWSPRGTDDFFMATGNALICLGFGAWALG